MFEWDPSQYRRFEVERTQPSRDLLARVSVGMAQRVVDLGCGPGNSTELLRARFPGAELCGVDGSPEMIAQARERLPEVSFETADVGAWARRESRLRGWDVVFSNATLHWLDDHGELFVRLFQCVRPGGCLAVQMPRNFDAPTHTCLRDVARLARFAPHFGPEPPAAVHEPAFYHDVLAPRASELGIWETSYLHAFPDADAVVQWVLGSAARPYLQRLADQSEREAFVSSYRAAIAAAYPPRPTGHVLMPFRRLFLVATR